jgi:hypothetical protein
LVVVLEVKNYSNLFRYKWWPEWLHTLSLLTCAIHFPPDMMKTCSWYLAPNALCVVHGLLYRWTWIVPTTQVGGHEVLPPVLKSSLPWRTAKSHSSIPI